MTLRDPEYVVSAVEGAVLTLLRDDQLLFRRGVSEWSVAHRLGVYLEDYFEEYPRLIVDCEFNRQPLDEDGSKYVTDQTKKIDGKIRRPDIVVHKRYLPEAKIDGYNLLAIELKVNEERDDDLEKIERLRSNMGYNYGVFIDFYENSVIPRNWDQSSLEWRPEELNEYSSS